MSQHQSEFPLSHSELNYALSNEPLLLNGMKILFDQSATVYPVSVQPRDATTRTNSTLKHLAAPKSQYSLPMMVRSRAGATIAPSGGAPTILPISAPSAAFPVAPVSAPPSAPVPAKAIAVLVLDEDEGGLLPKEYKELKKSVTTIRGWLIGLGLSPINAKYKQAIEKHDYEKAYFLWKDFKKIVDSLSQKKGDEVLDKDKTEKLYLLRLLYESYTEAFNSLLTLSKNDKRAVSRVPPAEERERDEREQGQYGQSVPKGKSGLSDESDKVRFLKEAQEYKEFFKDYAGSLKDDSARLVDLLENFVRTETATVSERADIEKILQAMRQAKESLMDEAESKEELDALDKLYQEEQDELVEIQKAIDRGDEIGRGSKTVIAERVAKKVASIATGYLAGLDLTRITTGLLETAKAANRIKRTVDHIKALKRLKEAERKDVKRPEGWKEITDFIIKQKTAKIGTSGAGIATVVPGVGYVITAGVEAHNLSTKLDRERYAKELLNWYGEKDIHAGLIILELVGIEHFRNVIAGNKVDAVAEKMKVL